MEIETEMFKNKDGVYTANHHHKVAVLWDLDNKPPTGPPYDAALALHNAASRFGDICHFAAFANRHAFSHLPNWVLEKRRERKQLDILERKGLSSSESPYICGVCGRKCTTNIDLKKHFKNLHQREREKKLGRMRSLKGKKRQKYRERFISGNLKYDEAAKELLTPKAGYGLASELRRAGVYVRTVEDKPQAADAALKRQMQHCMGNGVDCVLLVSDDSDFSEMLRRARSIDLQTVVVGDGGALRRHADVWMSWRHLQSELCGFDGEGSMHNLDFEESDYESESDGLDGVEVLRSGFSVSVSGFSGMDVEFDERNGFRILGRSVEDLGWESDEEMDFF
ncbi:hypothetical protein AMTR_s00051p00042220 [Amborella trichopoda]|uniref:C2H2-type domain-containing protein n=2 Tax=Amborella trichopoda TaxID=13333 RepID=U5D5C2_AMBTC|nr:hypothetical protein AMTR_s00051p00042220 [Amborella trichopoda]